MDNTDPVIVPPDTTPPDVDSSPPVPEPESPEPDTERELAEEREKRVRLEGKVEGLTSAARPAPPASPQQQPLTPDLIEQAFARGEITEPQRIQAHATLIADQRLSQKQQYDGEATSLRDATTQLESIIDQNPDLRDGHSELIGRVKTELARLQKRDPYFRPLDPRHQLLAVENVLGITGGGPAVTDREFQRRRAPAGGAGSGGGAPTAPARPGADPLKGIPADTVAYWRSHNWLPDPKAEKAYADRWRAQAARRRARLQGA